MRSVVTGSRVSRDVVGEMHVHRAVPVLAGPLLIVAAVLFAMRGFVFRTFLTDQHPDILAFWLPRWCSLGHSLRSGHLPVWNPLQFAGVPFAADPQSGWLYAPVMALFSTLGCGTALRAFIVPQPLLAGLGLYWFLRIEGLRRVAATAGGLSIAMLVATSNVGLSLPFDGMLAWTPFVLVAASRYLGARSLPARLGWLALGAFAWGQVASAHMSHGLAMASLAVTAYMVAGAVSRIRRGELTVAVALLLVAGFAAFLVLANAALFVPRMSLLGRSSLRGGYAAIGGAAARASGLVQSPLAPTGVWSGWPLALGGTPGAYAGAVILLAVPAAVRARDRALAIAFAVTGAISYMLTLNALVGARWFRHLVLNLPFGDVYLHNVNRLRYLLLLVVPVLGALGSQGLLERPPPVRRALLWVGAGVALWLVVPLAVGAHPVRFIVLAAAAAGAIPALAWLGRNRRAGLVVIAVLTLELVGSAAYSQAYGGGTVFLGLEPNTLGANLVPQPLRWPRIPVDAYLATSPIVRAMHRGPQSRYDTWDPPEVFVDKGYLYEQGSRTWPGLENGRGMLFGLQDSMGYSPVQLTRYWSWIRAVNATPVFYNAAVLHYPTLQDLRMLGVHHLIVPTDRTPPPSIRASPVVRWHGYTLYEVGGAEPIASFVHRWTVAEDGGTALHRVTAGGFDPAREAVVQRQPGIPQNAGAAANVAVGDRSPEEVVVTVTTGTPGLLVLRNSFDSNWMYSVDGREPSHVLAVDYFLQGVPVPAGKHVVDLRYHDPTIGRGLVISAAVWGAFALGLGAAWSVGRRRRRRRRPIFVRASR